MDPARELSKIYDIKKYSDYGRDYFYIEYNKIKLYVYDGYDLPEKAKNIDLHIKRIEFNKLFIDKITNLFIYTIKCCKFYDYIIVGNIGLCCRSNSLAILVDAPYKWSAYDNIDDLVEYLKLEQPECVKNFDIKIALKD